MVSRQNNQPRQLLFALESARNNLEAAEPIPPPSAERIAALENALKQLDAYVRRIRMCTWP